MDLREFFKSILGDHSIKLDKHGENIMQGVGKIDLRENT